jgi:hypothetical protein
MAGKMSGSGGYNFRSGGHQTGGAAVAEPKHPKEHEKGGKHKGGEKEGYPNEAESGLMHMKITPAENGHVIEHMYEPSGNDTYREPEHHVFEHEPKAIPLPQGHILHHIAKHLGIPHTVTKPPSEEDVVAEEEEGE